MVERGIAPLQLLTVPDGPAFMSAVAAGALTLIGSETAPVILDDELYDDPVRPVPQDWHEALERLGDESGPASATMRSWPHPQSPLQAVLRQALIVDGVTRGQLILVGRPITCYGAGPGSWRASPLRSPTFSFTRRMGAASGRRLLRARSPHCRPASSSQRRPPAPPPSGRRRRSRSAPGR